MNKEIEDLAKSLGCKVHDNIIFAPENYHFKSSKMEAAHTIPMTDYHEAELIEILKAGVESCAFVHCYGYVGGGHQCKFWASSYHQGIIRGNELSITDIEMKTVLDSIQKLNEKGYNGVKAVQCLSEIFNLLDVSINSLEEGARFSPNQFGLNIAFKLKEAVGNFKK